MVALNTNLAYSHDLYSLCTSQFWIIMRATGLLIALIILILMLLFQRHVSRLHSQHDSYLTLLRQHHRKQLFRIWIFEWVFLATTLLLIAYDITWMAQGQSTCKHLIPGDVVLENAVYILARSTEFYVRDVFCLWVIIRRSRGVRVRVSRGDSLANGVFVF